MSPQSFAKVTLQCDDIVECEGGNKKGDPSTSCSDACGGDCCKGFNACLGFTGSLCKDGVSCTGKQSCTNSIIGLVKDGCQGLHSCVGATIASVVESCGEERACAAITGKPSIENSCKVWSKTSPYVSSPKLFYLQAVVLNIRLKTHVERANSLKMV